MTKQINIEKLLENGEGGNLEFKRSFNNETIESLVAFANTQGGKVILGVGSENELVGIDMQKESVQNWINEIKQKTTPSIIPEVETFAEGDKKLVIFTVQEYPVKPVATRGKYFKRVANSNHLMGADEIANEHLKTINTSWDFYPDPNHNINDISIEKVKKVIHQIEKQSNSTIHGTPLEFLSKFEIVRKNQLTFGGYLLFAKQYCVISDVQVGRFKSDSKIIDSISLNSDLFTEVEEITAFIKKHLMVEFIITGEPQRIERFDYPPDAVREIVINMIVHRDYRNQGNSTVKIFDNRIEFYNPGKLPGNLTVEKLLSDNYISQARNKLVAKVFKESGLIERYGSGIRRILTICRNYGLKQPLFEEVFDGFRVILFKKEQDVPKDVPKDERLKIIIQSIQKEPGVTMQELAEFCNVSIKTIKRDIDTLKQNGLLKRTGGKKSGEWKILKNINNLK